MSTMRLSFLIIFLVKVQSFSCAKSNTDVTTEILFNLTNYVIESRRIRNPCIYQTNDVNYFACIKKVTATNYGLAQYPSNYAHDFYYHHQRPYQNPQNIMEVLYTISKNDVLRCVPRLLCEVMSDSLSNRRQGFTLPTLPFKLDMESVIKLLATVDLPGIPPVANFGKAALLGYVSKGNSDSCLNAYPTCPRDPNKLVQYLNNYNGGFFRFFNGLRPSQNYQFYNNYPYKNIMAEERIQNRPINDGSVNRGILSFPTDDESNEFDFRKPKELPFSINEYYSKELDLQKPLPNHKATPVIFPVRTGTGDLRLDAEELDANKHQTFYNLQNNRFVSFENSRPDEALYQLQAIPTQEHHSRLTFPV